jgi:hypothetical protein
MKPLSALSDRTGLCGIAGDFFHDYPWLPLGRARLDELAVLDDKHLGRAIRNRCSGRAQWRGLLREGACYRA